MKAMHSFVRLGANRSHSLFYGEDLQRRMANEGAVSCVETYEPQHSALTDATAWVFTPHPTGAAWRHRPAFAERQAQLRGFLLHNYEVAECLLSRQGSVVSKQARRAFVQALVVRPLQPLQR